MKSVGEFKANFIAFHQAWTGTHGTPQRSRSF